MLKEVSTRNHPAVYYGAAFVLWVVLDIVLSYKLDLDLYYQAFWISLFFYVFYPLLFLFVFYYLLWDVSRAFLLMFAVMLVIEALLFDNYLMYSFPDLFLHIPLGLCVWGLITIVPLWVAERQMKYHWGTVFVFVIGTLLLGVVNFL